MADGQSSDVGANLAAAPSGESQKMTHEMVRALCEAGYMPLPVYIAMCRENGWLK